MSPISAQELREDLDYLWKTIEETHPNASAYIGQPAFAALRQEAFAHVDHSMTKREFYWLIAPVVASLKNGHTCVYPMVQEFQQLTAGGGKYFPLELQCDGSKVILLDYAGRKDLPIGGTVETINGVNAAELTRQFAHCVADEGKNSNYGQLKRLMGLFLWAKFGDAESLTLKVHSLQGTDVTCVLAPLTAQEIQAAQQESHKPSAYSFRYLPDLDAGQIDFNSFGDLKRFKEFLAKTFKELQDKKASNLIIDIRKNPGGDSRLGDALLGYLTDKPFHQITGAAVKVSPLLRQQQPSTLSMLEEVKGGKPSDGEVIALPLEQDSAWKHFAAPDGLQFKGKLWLLIGPGSASSSVCLASAIKHYRLGTLVGEETSDSTSNYADSLVFTLPRSGLQVAVASKCIVSAGSNKDGHGVLPDHQVSPGNGGDDVQMKFVLDMIRKSNGTRPSSTKPSAEREWSNVQRPPWDEPRPLIWRVSVPVSAGPFPVTNSVPSSRKGDQLAAMRQSITGEE